VFSPARIMTVHILYIAVLDPYAILRKNGGTAAEARERSREPLIPNPHPNPTLNHNLTLWALIKNPHRFTSLPSTLQISFPHVRQALLPKFTRIPARAL
jgi:hypothetical protein